MSKQADSWIGLGLSGGRYRVQSLLGEGGMGFVFHCYDLKRDCEVVIKAPRRALLDDPEFAMRFISEIRSMVDLAHPHIVKVRDAGVHEGLPFAVMQFLSGGSLEDRRPQGRDAQPQPMAAAHLADWLPVIAEALDFVHGRGYIHRDVKPANILFDGEGKAYLSDFGVAKALGTSVDEVKVRALTAAGVVLGTPEYLAPEVIMGQKFDGRADQYALATTVFEVLAGRRPFEASTSMAVMVLQTTRPPMDLAWVRPGTPAPLVAAVHRGLAKLPEVRFADCQSFARAVLAAIVVARPAVPKPSGTPDRVSESPPAGSGPSRKPAPPPSTTPDSPAPPARRRTTPAPIQGPTTWQFLQNGQVRGPFVFTDLVEMARGQTLGRETLVREDRPGTDWEEAGSIAGLFAPEAKPARPIPAEPRPAPPPEPTPEKPPPKQAVAPVPNRRRRGKPVVLTVSGLAALALLSGALVIEAKRWSSPLVLAPIQEQLVNEETTLRLTARVEGRDALPDGYHFALGPDKPAGATIGPTTGAFSWTPNETEGPDLYTIEVRLMRDGRLLPIATRSFPVAVAEVNRPPFLDRIDARTARVDELVDLIATASDPDVLRAERASAPGPDPPDSTQPRLRRSKLTFRLDPPFPRGARLDPDSGRFTWTPSVLDSGKTVALKVRVVDSGLHALSATDQFTITVAPAVGALRRFEGHAGRVWSVALSADGRLALSGGENGSLRLWHTATGEWKALFGHAGSVHSVALSPDGRRAASRGLDPILRLWDAETGRPTREVPIEEADQPEARGRGIAFLGEGNHLVYENKHRISIYDINNDQELHNENIGIFRDFIPLEGPAHFLALPGPGKKNHTTISLCSYNENDRRLGESPIVFADSIVEKISVSTTKGRAFCAGSGGLELRDLATGHVWRRYSGRAKGVNAVALSPDGRFAYAGGNGSVLRIWDAATGEALPGFEGHTKPITCLAVSADGRFVLSGSDDSTVRLWGLPNPAASRPPE